MKIQLDLIELENILEMYDVAIHNWVKHIISVK